MELKVWAPNVQRVDLEIKKHRFPMKNHQGWWRIEFPANADDIEYYFVLDGGKPLPDPRSPHQPQGPFGPSKTIDHAKFKWTDSKWQAGPITSAVIYELHTGTFTPEGTFDAVLKKFDYLIDLGVTHIELMPVNGFSGSRGWGYDGVNLFAPHESYGGPDGLKRLVNGAHAKGLAVILDVVYNHFGPEGNFIGNFGPYFTDNYKSPWGRAINFDGPGSGEVRGFFTDNALMWLRDYHFDGLRIDAAHSIFDKGAVHILEQISQKVEILQSALGRNLTLIAESDLNDPRIINPREIGGCGIAAQWSDDFHHSLHVVLTGEQSGYYTDFKSVADIAKALKDVFVYDGKYSHFRQRKHGRKIGKLGGHKFLGYLQTHDQVGNRAKGERISHLISPSKVKIGAALVFFSPFIPLLFQGEEWGASSPFQYFTDFQDSNLGKAVKNGRRDEFAAFGWKPEDIPDPQDFATFENSKLKWDELDMQPHSSLLKWYRDLIKLRRQYPHLNDGRLDRVEIEFDDQAKWILVKRKNLVTICNFAEENRLFPLEKFNLSKIIMASEANISITNSQILLPSESAVILLWNDDIYN